ncbi:hypothetical protein PSTT_16763 [Puccinia striiformis]|uniref:DUF4219 domain-containing protein n=1 Tax=Puccinia striiformis TaxID=27350 RepID=A0A2S4UBT1_9BASI|nr:hypothetical protein PSTT_16763 [Puccinia striiformis]
MSNKPSPTTVSSKIRLDSTNYFGWIVQMQSRFRRLGCLDVVLGRAVKPEKPEAAADWVDKNEGAYFEIIDHVDVEHMTLIGGAVPPNQQFDGRFVWDLLKSKYAANDDVSKLVALEAFNELEFTTIPAFITTVRQINQRLILANFDLGNQLRNLMVLAKLPRDRFQSFRDIITMGFVAEDFESLLVASKTTALKIESGPISITDLIKPPSSPYRSINSPVPHARKASRFVLTVQRQVTRPILAIRNIQTSDHQETLAPQHTSLIKRTLQS